VVEHKAVDFTAFHGNGSQHGNPAALEIDGKKKRKARIMSGKVNPDDRGLVITVLESLKRHRERGSSELRKKRLSSWRENVKTEASYAFQPVEETTDIVI
jgi:hypothetical protein